MLRLAPSTPRWKTSPRRSPCPKMEPGRQFIFSAERFWRSRNALADAIQAYSACLAENPAHARAAYRRAACRNPLDARAADDYEAALALDATPDTGAPSPSLQRRPSLRLGVDAYAAKLEEDAAKGHFRAHFDRAYAYDAANDLPNAISEYTAAIRVLPAHALAWYNRGICRERLGDAAAALDDFTQAIQRAEASAKNLPSGRLLPQPHFASASLLIFRAPSTTTRRHSRGTRVTSRRCTIDAFCLDALGTTPPRGPPRLRSRPGRRAAERVGAPQPRRCVGEARAARGRRRSVRRPSTAACRRTPSTTTRAARMHATAATTRRRRGVLSRAQARPAHHRPPERTAPTPAGRSGISWARDGTTGRPWPTRRRPSCTTRAPTLREAGEIRRGGRRLYGSAPARSGERHARTTAASRRSPRDATTRPRATSSGRSRSSHH